MHVCSKNENLYDNTNIACKNSWNFPHRQQLNSLVALDPILEIYFSARRVRIDYTLVMFLKPHNHIPCRGAIVSSNVSTLLLFSL